MKYIVWVLGVCCLFGCSSQGNLDAKKRAGDEEKIDKNVVYENVATVDSFSGLSSEIAALLAERDIEYMISGSRSHSVAVAQDHVKECRLLLKKWRDANDKNVFIVGEDLNGRPVGEF